MNEPTTLIEAIKYFSDLDVCLDFMVKARWPNGVVCPTCGSTDVKFLSNRRVWYCKEQHAKKQFSVKVGTIFEDSPIGLDKWLAAVWMITNAKNGVSSYEVARGLGVTQKTAWFMLHRIRLAMGSEDNDKLSGIVEADETYIGGKAKNMHKAKREATINGRGGAGKVIVMGLLERGHGKKVKAKIIPNTSRQVIPDAVRDDVEEGSNLVTDALYSYNDLNKEYVHDVIDHAVAYVKGNVHTNNIKNFWSLLKRAIRGTYVNIEPAHLFRYLDEETFRYNARKDDDAGRFQDVVNGITGKRLTYNQLISGTTQA